MCIDYATEKFGPFQAFVSFIILILSSLANYYECMSEKKYSVYGVSVVSTTITLIMHALYLHTHVCTFRMIDS